MAFPGQVRVLMTSIHLARPPQTLRSGVCPGQVTVKPLLSDLLENGAIESIPQARVLILAFHLRHRSVG